MLQNLCWIVQRQEPLALLNLSMSSTPEFPPESNSMIYSPRSESSRPSTPTMSSSATVPLASTSRGRASYRFFNLHLKSVYESCVLPTETAFVALHSICSSIYSMFMEPKSSWKQVTYLPPQSMNLQRTFSLSLPFLGLASTDLGAQDGVEQQQQKRQQNTNKQRKKRKNMEEKEEEEEEEEVKASPLLRTMRIRLRLRSNQKKEVIKAIAVQRRAFNFAVDMVHNYGASAKMDKIRDAWNGWKEELKKNAFGDTHIHKWLTTSGVHSKIEAQGIRQMVNAFHSERQHAFKDKRPARPIRFRSERKKLKETLILEKGSTAGPLLRFLPVPYVLRHNRALCLVKIGGDQFTKTRLGYFLMEDKPDIIEKLVAESCPRFDGKIIWDKHVGSFHFIYTYEIPRLEDPDPAFVNKRIVATDPGVYPFQAWYSPTSGEFGRLLDKDSDVLFQRCQALDKLQSRVDSFSGGRTRRRKQRYKTKKRLRRRLARQRNRLRDWVKAAHYDCANILLRKHDLILQPTLQTARLSNRASRRIKKDSVRKMLTWSHYSFVQRLKSKSACYPGRHVIECNEPGTSKTCTHCGFWKADLKVHDKLFHCPSCDIKVDRQLAGARNNFLAAYGMAVNVGWDGMSG